MWKADKWAKSREARGGLIPTLKTDGGLVETAEQKVEAFRKVFSPKPSPADLSDIPMALLRKAVPRDYRIAKTYRPIVLLNTLGKILEAVATVRIAWALEERNLLPRNHLGGRRGISVDHLTQLLLDRIFESWGKDRKVSMMLLDVAGAFDNVSHIRLLHNLRMIGLGFFAGWLKSFLSNRSIRLQLPGYLSNLILIPTGIPQGSPISPILFLLFNTPLIRALSIDGIEALRIQPPLLEGGKTVSYGWIDDVATLAISDSYAVNQRLLERALDKAAVWSRQHSSKFASDKFELINFKNPLRQDPVLERSRIQTRAAVLISGAFRNTASAALVAELYLPPMQIQMQQTIQEAAIRIQIGPAMACPRGLRWERSKEAFKVSGYSPMEALKWKKTGPLYAYGSRQEEWETRRAHVLAPWELPLRCITEGAEEAVQTHDRICREDRQIWYTDGSGYQGIIRAAAVSIRADRAAGKYLGTELDSTAYVRELEGAQMTLDRAKPTLITVFSDSQAAIQAVRNPGRPSGQYALRTIYGRFRALRSEGLEDIELR
ncbi:reverse transcriptase [Aspergillus affinis]|uniref:reverse transcriptase n=1 Tax=Aspergillus affinis TaxID=1070780 RepID=UPI0022FEA7C2|nr:reverse transcriptase [Aspergillus affinis]KAI9035972.1 reverse transcriptase [Aspergillus affinis]